MSPDSVAAIASTTDPGAGNVQVEVLTRGGLLGGTPVAGSRATDGAQIAALQNEPAAFTVEIR